MKTIYNTYVEMESQEQCDRMKQLCIDNGLDIWEYELSFTFIDDYRLFEFAYFDFYVTNKLQECSKQKITEQEFIKLLKKEQANNKPRNNF